jgi:uncharacterized damage-inducible protein DinB
MRAAIINNLQARFDAYADLIDQLDDDTLQEKFDIAKHKSLAEHLWCIVGARESYAKALVAGQWQGFGCSITGSTQQDFRDGLRSSADEVVSAICAVDDWTDEREALLATLSEHEVMHEGQIIRHVLGTGHTLPPSWKWA